MPEGNSPAYPLSGLLSGLSLPIRVDDVDPYRLATCEGGHHGAQCAGRPPRATDDTTEVIGMNPDLENLAATQLLAPDSDIFVMIDNALDEVLERILEHDQASALASSDASATSTTGASTTGDSAFSAFSAFSTLGSAFSAFSTLTSAFSTLGSAFSAFSTLTSAFSTLGSALSAFSTLGSAFSAFSTLGSALSALLLRAVVAPDLGSDIAALAATSNSAFLSAFGSATRRVPSVPGRPLYFCQSPVIFNSTATCSVG